MTPLSQQVMAVMAARRRPLDIRDLIARVKGGTSKEIMLAIYRLLDTHQLVFTSDRRITRPPSTSRPC